MAPPTNIELMERVRTLEQLLTITLAELDTQLPDFLVRVGLPGDAVANIGDGPSGVSADRMQRLLGRAQERRDEIQKKRGV